MSQLIAILEAQGIFEKEYGEQIRQQVLDLAKQDYQKILIDFSQVSFMNSTGLGILVSIYTTLKKIQKELFLCSINEQIKIIFELTGMDSCFVIYDDQATFQQSLE